MRNENHFVVRFSIHTCDFKPTDALLHFVRENVGKLENVHHRIRESKVLLKVDNEFGDDNKVCEIKIIFHRSELFASRRSSTFKEAVLQTVIASQRQIERWKTMNQEKKDSR